MVHVQIILETGIVFGFLLNWFDSEMQLGVTYNVHTSNNDQIRVVLSAIHEKTMQTTQKLIQ